MSSFTAPLVYQNTDRFGPSGLRYYRMMPNYAADVCFRFYVGAVGSSMWVDVPAGYESDLASIPRFARIRFSPDGPWAQMGVLHDWLYSENLVSRAIADRIFLESMAVPLKGQPEIKREDRWMMYAAVRVGGGRAYARYGAARRGDEPAA